MTARFALLVMLALPADASAQNLAFPAPAEMTDSKTEPSGTLAISIGPWSAGTGTPKRNLAGSVSQTAYRLAGPGLSTRDLLSPLREGLLTEGFVLLFECETEVCGGFDFRYDLPLLPEPGMHIDLGDFRYLAATRQQGDGEEEAVMVIVSRSANAGFVQVNRVGGQETLAAPILSTTSRVAPLPASPPTVRVPVEPTGDIGVRLETGGAIALDDLNFPSGADTLAPGAYASLSSLAAYLSDNPDRQIAIVGHTDASGALQANVALSRRRAESVRRVLIDTHGARPAQVQAEGVGYLSPRATNLTEQGRAANRRVEVMLTTTE